MDLEIGLSTTVAGLSLKEIVFSGGRAREDRAAFDKGQALFEDLLERHDPDAVLLNLLGVDQILIDDLRELVTVAVADRRPKGPRICAVAVRMSWSLVNLDGTPVHSFTMPGLLTCGPDHDFNLQCLEEHLKDRAAEPKGQPPIYFPAKAFHELQEQDGFTSDWFSKYLWRMGEPSLFDLSRRPDYHGYRFLWLRTFDKPVCVRLEIVGDGTGILVSKMASGQGRYFPGCLEVNDQSFLGPKAVIDFMGHLKKTTFWRKNISRNKIGCDGAEWIIEGAREECYRVAWQWSPKEGAFRETALFLIRLSGMSVGKVY